MNQQNQPNKLSVLDVTSYRHPVISQLQNSFFAKKPANPVQFIKSWAMQKLKEIDQVSQDDEDNEKQKMNHKQSKIYLKKLRRRDAVVMAKYEQTQHSKQFLLKVQLIKNQQCKSRIMIGLRSVPFLNRFGWEDIHHLVELSEVRQYYKDEIFVTKGQFIDRLYILISGQIKRLNGQKLANIYSEGSYLFAEALITSLKATNTYTISSERAWICGIQAYSIHERLRYANQKRQDYFQQILMNVSLFTCLDHEEMYKLVLMVKQLPSFKPDQIVLEKDDPVSRLFLVAKGQFNLCRKNLSGQITALQTFRQGQFFDEEWIRIKSFSEVTVISRTEGTLCYIDRESIQEGIAKIDHLIIRKKMKKLGK